jgi:A/G-specific adenine glycosylase
LELPGVGRYTAGAICSIAFNQPTPILDGNVVRVLARLFAIAGDPKTPKTNARFWKASTQLVSRAAALPAVEKPCGSLNQALMELGALICTPNQPRCLHCPVRGLCVAFQTGRVEALPSPQKRPKVTRRHMQAFVAHAAGRVLVRRRPGHGLNAQLWEFPNIELTPGPVSPEQAAAACLGWSPAALHPICSIRHSITRYRIRLDAYWIEVNGSADRLLKQGTWRKLTELDELAFPSAHRKIAAALSRRNRARFSRAVESIQIPDSNAIRPREKSGQVRHPGPGHRGPSGRRV